MQKKKVIVNRFHTLMSCPFSKSLYNTLGNMKQFNSQGHKIILKYMIEMMIKQDSQDQISIFFWPLLFHNC